LFVVDNKSEAFVQGGFVVDNKSEAFVQGGFRFGWCEYNNYQALQYGVSRNISAEETDENDLRHRVRKFDSVVLLRFFRVITSS
jgi:hypothetical protein